MLPFMKAKNIASVIVAKRKADGSQKIEGAEGEPKAETLSPMESFISAIHGKDASAAVMAFEQMVKSIDQQPHKEGPHET